MSRAFRFLLLILIVIALPAGAAKQKKPKAKDLVLPRGSFPAITEEQKALTDVEFAQGAPAVVLLEVEQNEWESVNLEFKRLRIFRRVKILDESGIEDHGNYSLTLIGDWRVQGIDARTVNPDGEEFDAADGVNRETSDNGVEVIQIAFPQVQVGSILDVNIRVNANAFRVDPYIIQESIPVLESRLVMLPPVGLRYRTMVFRLPQEANKPISFPYGAGGKAFVWRFQNAPPLPDLANLPPTIDISQRLFVILESYKTEFAFFPLASDWKSWNESTQKDWDDWMKLSHKNVTSLARQVAENAAGPVEKAEAIRLAMRDRYEVTRVSTSYNDDTPDEQLDSGRGTSGALAALTVVMLRSLGEQAHLAAIRRRSDGFVPVEFPTPSLFNDLMVRLRNDDEDLYYSPGSDLHVTSLPFDCSGVVAMPFDGTSEAPVTIKDFDATSNRARRTVESTLSENGDLSATSTETYRGVAAEVLRNWLKDRTDEERHERAQSQLRRHMPGATLTKMEFDNFDDASKDLIIRRTWNVPGYATVAGKRLIFNPNLYDRVLATDWAPEQREFEIDLGRARETIDTLLLTMPEGVAKIELPDRAKFEAGPVGVYETNYERRGRTLITKRRMQLNMYRFPPQSYAGLRRWFSDIAMIDDKPVVLQMP